MKAISEVPVCAATGLIHPDGGVEAVLESMCALSSVSESVKPTPKPETRPRFARFCLGQLSAELLEVAEKN